jgi:hypothetical protein
MLEKVSGKLLDDVEIEILHSNLSRVVFFSEVLGRFKQQSLSLC